MVTWRLWRALNRPPLHTPIYLRAYAYQYRQGDLPDLQLPLLNQITTMFKNMGMVVLPVVLILFGTPVLVLSFYIALLIAPFLLPIANTIFGLVHASGASSGIARERDRRTYDVLCTAPPGTLGMHWAYCTGWLHYHSTFRTALLGVLAIGIVASIFGLTAQVVFGADQASPLVVLVRGLALSAIFVIDYAQSIVISSMTSLLIPTHAENEGNARLWACTLFLGLQLAVYLPTLLISVVALPNTFQLLGMDATASALIAPLLYVAFFVALREVIIIGMWRRVEAELSTTRVELDAITRVAV